MSQFETSAKGTSTPESLEQDLRLLLDHAPDPISRFDRQLRHVYVNEATARANQRPASDFYLSTMEDLGHAPEVCDLINTGLNRVFVTGKEHAVEILFDGPAGPQWYQCRMAPELNAEGWVTHVLVISRDLSEVKRSQAALREREVQAAIARLAGSLAHEIHNPLSTVMNALYLLTRNPSLDDQARELVDLATRELERVAETSKRSLLFGRGDSLSPREHAPQCRQ